jgi:F-type H+-transporting ATPase subunit c
MGMIIESKTIGAGLATIASAGAGNGTGITSGNLLVAVSRNPNNARQSPNYALSGFAFTEAIALFTLMIVSLISSQVQKSYYFFPQSYLI